MNKLPTDLEILECIYTTYADSFREYSKADPNRSCKIYVPIDVRRVAELLQTDPFILHGRLYYHLDEKYGYTQDNGSEVHLFSHKVGDNLHCIHYPFLAAIVSEKTTEHRRNLWALWVSILSLGVALSSMVVAIVAL